MFRAAPTRFRVGALALLLLLVAPLASPGREALPAKWTATDPPINLVHIDFGEINRHGEAVGYHHRPNGLDRPAAKVVEIVQPPDAHGVYRARVALRDPATGNWVGKKTPSTFYPNAMSDPDVVAAVLSAFRSGHMRRDGRFVGASGRGFMIEGWYQAGHINAAYPLRGP